VKSLGLGSHLIPSFSCLSFVKKKKCFSRPDFAAAWMNLGIVQNSLKRFEEAEQSYRTAIKHRRKYPDCYYNLGRLVRAGGPSFPSPKTE
jgi:tetratricopeptide (TPR) repeat protein